MKRWSVLAVCLCLLLTGIFAGAGAESAEDLYEAGVKAAEIGDYAAAIGMDGTAMRRNTVKRTISPTPILTHMTG